MRVELLTLVVLLSYVGDVLSQMLGAENFIIRYPPGPKYELAGFIGEQTTLVIGIKADRDAHMLITPDEKVANYLEYIVGGYGNTETMISKDISHSRYPEAVKVVMHMLYASQYSYFWLDWSDGMTLKTGTGTDPGNPSTMLLFAPLTVRPVRFLWLSAHNNVVYYTLIRAMNPCFVDIYWYRRRTQKSCLAAKYKKPRGQILSTRYNHERVLNPSKYRTEAYIGGQTSLLILVKGNGDGSLILSTGTDLTTTDLYEHIIGGSSNREHNLRSPIYKQSRLLSIKYNRHNALDPNGYRWFWVDWSDGKTLKAGEYSVPGDPKSLNVEVTRQLKPTIIPRFLSFAAYGNTVKYVIPKDTNQCFLSIDEYNSGRAHCGYNPIKEKCLTLGCCWDSKENLCYQKKRYEYYYSTHNPIATLNPGTYVEGGYIGGMTSLVVSVKGSRDGHVVLSENTDLRTKVFEFVIGGWGDTGVVLRSRIYGHQLAVRRDIRNIISSRKYSAVWLDWRGRTLTVGGGGWPGRNRWLSVDLSSSTSNLNFAWFSAYNNFVEYKVYKSVDPDYNKCFLSMHEYHERVKCGKNLNVWTLCESAGCCWDHNNNFCFYA